MATNSFLRGARGGAAAVSRMNSLKRTKSSKSSCSCGVRGVALHLSNTDLRSETTRLSTYQFWPKKAPVGAVDLSKAGLYYTGKKDYVKCVYCDVMIGDWSKGDNASIEHKRLMPNCPSFHAVCASSTHQHVSLKSRLETFTGHEDKFRAKTPYELSDAGFYYIGKSDNVVCFSCGTAVGEWQPEDDPWTEHAPQCAYVKQIKTGSLANELSRMVTDLTSSDNKVLPDHNITVTADVTEEPKTDSNLRPASAIRDDSVGSQAHMRLSEIPHLVPIFAENSNPDDEGYDTGPGSSKPVEGDLNLVETILEAPSALTNQLQGLLDRGISLHHIITAAQMELARDSADIQSIDARNLKALSEAAQQLEKNPTDDEANWVDVLPPGEATKNIQQVLGMGFSLQAVVEVVKAKFASWGNHLPSVEVLANALVQ